MKHQPGDKVRPQHRELHVRALQNEKEIPGVWLIFTITENARSLRWLPRVLTNTLTIECELERET